jgi:cytochrome c oxidase subunit 3
MAQAIIAATPFEGEDRGTPYLGMMVALVSWAMMFAALFLSYLLLRAQQQTWPPLGTPPLPMAMGVLNTGILLASSATFAWAARQVARQRQHRFVGGLIASTVLGFGFLALQLLLWQQTHTAGLGLRQIFGGLFYLLSWFHAAHIVGGLAAMIWLLFGAFHHRYGPGRQVPVHLVGAFWHFLDVMWICMFVGIFLV